MRLWEVLDVDMWSQPVINDVVFTGTLEECRIYVHRGREEYRRIDPMQSTPIWKIEPAAEDANERLRAYIDEFGYRTLRIAWERRVNQKRALNELDLPDELVEGCVAAGAELRRRAEEQRQFEATIVEPY